MQFGIEDGWRVALAVLPKSALGQAVAYTLNQWPKLRRCFDYAEMELSDTGRELNVSGGVGP